MNTKTRRILATCTTALVARLLKGLGHILTAADPNWSTVSIKLESYPGQAEGQDTFAAENGYFDRRDSYKSVPSFEARPVFAFINGPKDGDVALPIGKVIKAIEPQLLVALVALRYQLGRSSAVIELSNPSHKFEVIPGTTYLSYENVAEGVVLTGDTSEFIAASGISLNEVSSLYRYSEERLMADINADPYDQPWSGCAVDYGYLPRRYSWRAEPLQSPDERQDVTNQETIELVARLPKGENYIYLD